VNDVAATTFSVVLFVSYPLHVSVIRPSAGGNTQYGKTCPNGSTVIGPFVLLNNLYLYWVKSSLVGIGC
jgi:hypothetical protein